MRTRIWIALAAGALALAGCSARVGPAAPDADAGADAVDVVDVAVDAAPPTCLRVRRATSCEAVLEWEYNCPAPDDIDFRTTAEQRPEVCERHCPALTGSRPLACQGYRGHGTSFLACRRCP